MELERNESWLKMTLFCNYFESPIGLIQVCSDDSFIVSCKFVDKKGAEAEIPMILAKALVQLEEFFSGERVMFELNLAPSGTEFQQKVWLELLQIPYGETITYRELASRIGEVNAVRAVGKANSKNPISIIIPCHRVIGSNGKLTGYSGGLEKKEWLLKFEKNYVKKK